MSKTESLEPRRFLPLSDSEMAEFARIAEADNDLDSIARAAGPIDEKVFGDFVEELDPMERVLAHEFLAASRRVHGDNETASTHSNHLTEAVVAALFADLPVSGLDVAAEVAKVHARRQLSPVLQELLDENFSRVPPSVYALRHRGRVKSKFRVGPTLARSAKKVIARTVKTPLTRPQMRRAYRNLELAIEETVTRSTQLDQFRN